MFKIFKNLFQPKFRSTNLVMEKLDMIEEHLYLSGCVKAENLDLLKEYDIKYVLSVFNDNLSNKSDAITYMEIDVDDDPSQDIITHFPEANKFIETAQKSQKNVLVHCHAGLSRSATIVLAFIMNKHKMSYESARELVNTKHVIWPNDGFRDQLKLFEKIGFTLNANNRELRQHLMKTCVDFVSIWYSRNENRIETYFERRDYIESITQDLDLGKRCLCANCGQHLFNEIHILPTNDIPESFAKEECPWTYIEPQKWMTALTKPFKQMTEFEIKCTKCGQNLLEFKVQFVQYWCECPLHKGQPSSCLRFRIAKQKFKTESNV